MKVGGFFKIFVCRLRIAFFWATAPQHYCNGNWYANDGWFQVLLVCLNIKKKGKDWLAFLPKIYWPVPVGGGGGGGGLLTLAVYQFSSVATWFQKNTIPKPTIFIVPVLLTMQMDYAQRTICITSSGYPPAELAGNRNSFGICKRPNLILQEDGEYTIN